MNKPGFFLIETLIYLLIFSLLIMIMLRMSVSSVTQLTQSRAQISRISSMHALLQRFVKDIEIAPASQDQWHVIKPDMLIWHHNNESIGWMMEKNNLVRHQGSYNLINGTWGKKTKSIGAKNIKTLSFELDNNEDQVKEVRIAVEVYLHDKQCKTFVCKASLRNRTLS